MYVHKYTCIHADMYMYRYVYADVDIDIRLHLGIALESVVGSCYGLRLLD